MFDGFLNAMFDPGTTSGVIVYAAAFFLFALLLSYLVGAWSHRLATHPSLFVSRTSATFIRQLLQILIFLLAATIYAHLVPALHQLSGALLASAGVISLVVGLAAQQTLGQLIAGIALLLYRPFEMDQTLTVLHGSGKEETGIVREFTLGYTRLQAADGRSIVIPNSVMLSTMLIRSGGPRSTSPVP